MHLLVEISLLGCLKFTFYYFLDLQHLIDEVIKVQQN